MPNLHFRAQHTYEELETIAVLADEFLAPGEADRLSRMRFPLQSIMSAASDRDYLWVMGDGDGLRTTASNEYRRGHGSGPRVRAVLSWVWCIRPSAHPARRPAQFAVTGKASTKIQFFEYRGADQAEIPHGMWRIDQADWTSPGCFFHVQLNGDSPAYPFPAWLDVPRIPNLAVTPPAALEFILAELFQDRWAARMGRDDPPVRRWRGLQRDRLASLLRWQADEVANCDRGAPWVKLKEAKPDPAMFIA
jgi:hypothetical protein